MKRNRLDIIDLYKKKNKPLVLDGAIGSLIQNSEHETDNILWASLINFTKPEVVVGIHKSYIDAGANIITTNTFRTNPYSVKISDTTFPQNEFVKRSVELAVTARGENQVIIAGSNAPAEDCYQKERTITHNELEHNHKTHIDQLWQSGCDIILNETQSHFDEIKIISEHCSGNSIPFIMSLFFTSDKKLLSGEPIEEIIDFILDYSPQAIGFNCVTPPSFNVIVIDKKLHEKWGFYLNCGSGNYKDEKIECAITPQDYVNEIKKYIEHAPLFIGSCCGSSPHHTKEIRNYIDEIYRD